MNEEVTKSAPGLRERSVRLVLIDGVAAVGLVGMLPIATKVGCVADGRRPGASSDLLQVALDGFLIDARRSCAWLHGGTYTPAILITICQTWGRDTASIVPQIAINRADRRMSPPLRREYVVTAAPIGSQTKIRVALNA